MSSLLTTLHRISRKTAPGSSAGQRLERHGHLHDYKGCPSAPLHTWCRWTCSPLPGRSFPACHSWPAGFDLCFRVLLKIHLLHKTLPGPTATHAVPLTVFPSVSRSCGSKPFLTQYQALLRWELRGWNWCRGGRIWDGGCFGIASK